MKIEWLEIYKIQRRVFGASNENGEKKESCQLKTEWMHLQSKLLLLVCSFVWCQNIHKWMIIVQMIRRQCTFGKRFFSIQLNTKYNSPIIYHHDYHWMAHVRLAFKDNVRHSNHRRSQRIFSPCIYNPCYFVIFLLLLLLFNPSKTLKRRFGTA